MARTTQASKERALKAKVKDLCLGIVESPAYLEKVQQRAESGSLPPAVETMLWHYAFGKPAETVELKVQAPTTAELQDLSDEALAERSRRLAEQLSKVGFVYTPPRADPAQLCLPPAPEEIVEAEIVQPERRSA